MSAPEELCRELIKLAPYIQIEDSSVLVKASDMIEQLAARVAEVSTDLINANRGVGLSWKAIGPVRDWYEGDGEIQQPLLHELIASAVADLQADRTENLDLRARIAALEAEARELRTRIAELADDLRVYGAHHPNCPAPQTACDCGLVEAYAKWKQVSR